VLLPASRVRRRPRAGSVWRRRFRVCVPDCAARQPADALGSGCFALVDGPALLLVGRIWQGLALGTATAAATVLITESMPAAGLFLAVIPMVLNRAAGVTNPASIGGIVGAVLVCSVLAQPLVARCGPGRAQLLGLGAVLGSLLTLTLTGGGSLFLTMAAAVAGGAGNGLACGGATAAIDATAPDGHRASINGGLYPAFYLGTALPAVAVGLLTLTHPRARRFPGSALSQPLSCRSPSPRCYWPTAPRGHRAPTSTQRTIATASSAQQSHPREQV